MINSILLLLFSVFATENLDPISWEHEVIKNDDNTYNIVFKAAIEENWVLYSQHTDPEGPVPTSFTFGTNDCIQLIGDVEEKSEMILEKSDLFGVDVMKYKSESIFEQKVQKDCDSNLNCIVLFMTCDGERCLPPKRISFEVQLN